MSNKPNKKVLKLIVLNRPEQATELLRCVGWELMTSGCDLQSGAPRFVLAQYRPFSCPKCGKELKENQVTIDFVMGHRIACNCQSAPFRLSGVGIDEYFDGMPQKN